MPLLNELAQKAYDAERTYGDVVHFVHVIVIEPHPLAPDPSPYQGEVWEYAYSTIRQPLTYAARQAAATDVERLLAGEQLLLVDDLEPGVRVNPVWCTYGPMPNCAFLIEQDGTIRAAWAWLEVDALESAIDDLLGS